MFLLAAMAGLGVVGTLVNAGAGVFVVYAAALAGRLYPVRRAVVAVAVLAGLAGVMFLISTVPLPWRLLAVGPIIVFVLVIGAAGSLTANASARRPGCVARTRKSSGWPRSPSASASHVTCTTCSVTPCRWSC